MRKYIVDQNIIIGLHASGYERFLTELNKHTTAIYVLDSNLYEALESGSSSLESILRALAPFRERVFAGPHFAEVIHHEKEERRAATASRIVRVNRTDWLREIILEASLGKMPAQSHLGEVEKDPELLAMLEGHKARMVHYYQSAHNAWEKVDRMFDLKKEKSILADVRSSGPLEIYMIDQCIRHALSSMKEFFDEENAGLYWKLVGRETYMFIYSLTHWIRAYQQAESNRMKTLIKNESSEILNEYFDVVGVSFYPYFSDYLTNDKTSLATKAYLKQALEMFRARRHQYLRGLKTGVFPNPTTSP